MLIFIAVRKVREEWKKELKREKLSGKTICMAQYGKSRLKCYGFSICVQKLNLYIMMRS